MALHLLTESLKPSSGWKPVSGCEASTSQPYVRWFNHYLIMGAFIFFLIYGYEFLVKGK